MYKVDISTYNYHKIFDKPELFGLELYHIHIRQWQVKNGIKRVAIKSNKFVLSDKSVDLGEWRKVSGVVIFYCPWYVFYMLRIEGMFLTSLFLCFLYQFTRSKGLRDNV
jgi:hypothetical protein